ncbi:MAG: hypothetical protein FD129_702 [bacterium]|nr:MAG: hypothetical protein FD129_702 [bacterium]
MPNPTHLSVEQFLRHLGPECARTRLYLQDLRPEDLVRSPAPGMMTARELALHLIGCLEWLRMAAVHGDGDFAHFKVTLEFDDGAGAAAHALQSYRRLRDELTALTEAEFNRPMIMFRRETTASDLCLELLLHEMHHRGQLGVILRSAGRTPPDLHQQPLPDCP